MSLETKLRTLERTIAESAPQETESITVETVLGELSIPIRVLPTIEKIYGGKASEK